MKDHPTARAPQAAHRLPPSAPAPTGPSRRNFLRITAVAGISLGVGGGFTVLLLRQAGLHRVRATRIRMGTPVTLTVIHPDAAVARELVEGAFREMARLEGILSRHRDDTPLSLLNREGRLVAAPVELLEVVDAALDLARRSEGAFDPTIAPLLELHRSRFASTGAPPTPAEREALLPLVNHRAVGRRDSGIQFARPGMALTLDGIAKGFIVDRTAALLQEGGAERVLVDAGGDLASGDRSGRGEPWTVAIRHPRDPSTTLGTVELRGRAAATSGDYIQSFSPDRLHHHILDPRTGMSPVDVSSVTVLAPTAMEADALSTAAFVLGAQRGAAFLEVTPGAEGLLVTREGVLHATKGFDRVRG